ncbi:hypothetical protein ACHAP4_009925 [Fusarium culmorum]
MVKETDIPAGPGPNDSSDSSDSGDSEKPYILAATIPSAAYVQYTNVGDTHVKTTDDDFAVSFKDDIDDFDVDWNVVHRRYIHTPDYKVDNDILTGNNVDGVNTRDPAYRCTDEETTGGDGLLRAHSSQTGATGDMLSARILTRRTTMMTVVIDAARRSFTHITCPVISKTIALP